MLLFLFFFAINFAQTKEIHAIGLLVTKFPACTHQLSSYENFKVIAEKFGAKLEVIDCNALHLNRLKNITVSVLEEELEKEISQKNIKKIIVPSNYCNTEEHLYASVENRQKLIKALFSLAKQKKLKMLGICGGMQELLSADKIAVKNLKDARKDNNFFDSDLYNQNIRLNKVLINPASWFAKIAQNHQVEATNNGWLVLYIPNCHSEVVDFDQKNMDLLRQKGYKIIGFSQDGIIEIMEDDLGNMYFQSQLEKLILQKDMYIKNEHIDASVMGVERFFEYFFTAP